MVSSGNIHSNVDDRWLILVTLFLARTAMAFQFQAVAAISSFVIVGFGINYARLGLLIGLYLFPGVIIAYPGGLLGRHFGDRRIALIGMMLMVAGGLLTVTNDYSTALAGRLVSGTGAVLVNVLLTKMTTDWFADREIGTALAVLVSVGRLASVWPWWPCHGSLPVPRSRRRLPVRQRLPRWCLSSLRSSIVIARARLHLHRRPKKDA
jgi:predicted MFS family arabinose efflux permease